MFTAWVPKSEMWSCTDTTQSQQHHHKSKDQRLESLWCFLEKPKDLFSAFVFFCFPLFFCLVGCMLPSIFNSKCKRQLSRSERQKFLLVLLFLSAHSDTSTPSLALVFPISMLFPLSSLPQSPQLPVVPLFPFSVPPYLVPALVFWSPIFKNTRQEGNRRKKKYQTLLARLLFCKWPNWTLCYFYFKNFLGQIHAALLFLLIWKFFYSKKVQVTKYF